MQIDRIEVQNMLEAACAQAVQYDIGVVMEKAGLATSMSSDIYFGMLYMLSSASQTEYNFALGSTPSYDRSVVSLERQWKRERNPVAKLNLARQIFYRKGGRR